ncbi:mitochondrial ribosomal small subunit component [Kickxella alabastrina]|uniref:Mitochondrial ribosomal small subunit component n=1 Tax=Kickxella alabastrina TaxID=61397 RepID=A0ACC1ING0_9FUNG|nr:mitochondrial ribosomal small subunit component [Kickxella alabastrina]
MFKKPSAARGVRQTYEQLLNANLREHVPAWLHAMRSVPPSDSLVRDPTQFSTGGKLSFETTDATASTDAKAAAGMTKIRRALPEGCVSIRHGKAHLRTRSTRPPKIEFPEDRLRRVFYKNHPFEKSRPRIVMEPTGKTCHDWSQLSHGSSQVTGENVVRYQHFLMQSENMSEQEAYVQATSEFYKIRAREEIEAKIARQEARSYGARMLEKPFSAKQLSVENREIRRSAKAFELRQEEQRLRNVTSEKMFAAAGETA